MKYLVEQELSRVRERMAELRAQENILLRLLGMADAEGDLARTETRITEEVSLAVLSDTGMEEPLPIPEIDSADLEEHEPEPGITIKAKQRVPWTPEEDAILMSAAVTKDAIPLLPRRARAAIYTRKSQLKRLKTIAQPAVAPAIGPTAREPEAEPEVDRRFSSERFKPPLSFEEQLRKVANGAGITEVVPIRKPDPAMTLGGVAPQMI